MPKRKSFLDKKKSVAFRLLHRSQKDPLIATDDGEFVLAPIEGVEKLSITEPKKPGEKRLDDRQRREEQAKFGVYFDDDYDYLQHLRDVNEVYSLEPINERFRVSTDGVAVDAGKDIAPSTSNNIQLSSRLFESKGVELKIGLLNQAAPCPGPHPELDPDIVQALDDDSFDFDDPENQLEDDFVVKANAPGDVVEPAHRSKIETSDNESDTDDSDSYEDDEENFDEEETRSRFTNYSLTSSVMQRSKGLQQVDAMFEKLYDEYDEEEMGDLDVIEEEITGFLDPDGQRMRQLVEEYEEDKQMKEKISEIVLNEKDPEILTRNPDMYNVDDDDELVKIIVDDQPKEKWDCESVLSMYSNLYNHPTLISEPKKSKRIHLNPRTGLPQGVLKSSTLAPALKELDDDDRMSVDTACKSKASTIRSKFESPEQKRLRKKMIKAERKDRRVERKGNKLAFKSEEKRRYIVQLNLQQNLSGVKLL